LDSTAEREIDRPAEPASAHWQQGQAQPDVHPPHAGSDASVATAEAPPPEPASPASPEEPVVGESGRPRRRSTVREPAPAVASAEIPVSMPTPPTELPQPVVSSTADADDEARPRRSGWWSRRVLGKG
jgi:ribonuclease E